MTEVRAIDIAKWFIKNEFDTPRNTFDGNMKLQKLLFFSQLIHIAKYGKVLFLEEMKAYENGTVINEVRLPYKTSLYYLIDQSNQFDGFTDVEVNDTLRLTVELFGDMSASELSELNHELLCWKIPFNNSKTDKPKFYQLDKNTINITDPFFMEDIKRVKQMVEEYDKSDDSMEFEIINGVTFYYDPNQLQITDEIAQMLEGYDYPEEAYFVTFDEEQGIIIS
ncbi:type II toxin-antitoxin system antitoxin SocA domain-containing protein [Robertmurraya massiliosenegalensis]|uniref:Panacea domain-containing protein n=1 Tax=Robertmurraya TaxID=2837507 RepID=UPI0039A6CABE